MKTVAYLRVSTGGQDLDSQRLAILDYAHRYHLHIDDFVEVTVSSRKTLKERGIEGLCAGMQAGDLTVVSELSRLWRGVGQIIQIVDDLVKNQIRFVAIKEGSARDTCKNLSLQCATGLWRIRLTMSPTTPRPIGAPIL